ncbi:DUF4169 family protein [Acuticoccus kandeliae]|uniref:DUF4169 family protein n=1 Tax=Acuticoccus kandeliae TaxID=2073160 RepID=UPI000D3E2226|nr:DUF4169 family protein [Acuticoccus kandeliae]
MGPVINLRRVRKERQRDAEKATAAQNRAKFGRPRHEKERDDANASNADAKLEAHRIDRPE